MLCYVLPFGFVSGSHPSFMLFTLFINPIFKAYIEIMATCQSVNLFTALSDLQRKHHYAVHTPWPEQKRHWCLEAECLIWEWQKKDFLLFRHQEKRKNPYPRGRWTKSTIFAFTYHSRSYLGESEARTADLNEDIFWGLFCLRSVRLLS